MAVAVAGLDLLKKVPGLKELVRRTVPRPLRPRLVRHDGHLSIRRPLGFVRFGSLRRISPLSDNSGFDRGTPIDRYYIGQFLDGQRARVRGRVLDIYDDHNARTYGHDLTSVDVLHLVEGNPLATLVGDLADAPHIPDERFDCVLLVQTLQLAYDLRAVVRTVERILKPGGAALVTLPVVSPIYSDDSDKWDDCWRLTSASARRLFEEFFPPPNVTVEARGNVMTATAFLYGLAAEELRRRELDHRDPKFEVLLGIVATKRD